MVHGHGADRSAISSSGSGIGAVSLLHVRTSAWTAWHAQFGQTVIVMAGSGSVQRWRGPIEENSIWGGNLVLARREAQARGRSDYSDDTHRHSEKKRTARWSTGWEQVSIAPAGKGNSNEHKFNAER